MSEQPPARDHIVNVIEENPGIHFREIQRKTGLAVGQIEYHLFQLEKEDEIVIREDGNLKRYFNASRDSFLERQLLFYMRNSFSREVLQKLTRVETVPLYSLMKGRKSKLDKKKQTMEDMEKDSIIEVFLNEGLDYVRIREREKLLSLVKKYRESFLETLSDSFFSLLDEEQD